MADNLVSQPPLTTAMVDELGRPSRAWSIFFRDLYRRTAYKGGNAIDDNEILIDDTIETLAEAVAQILVNSAAISANQTAIQTNVDAIQTNADNLQAHEDLEEAHDSNGVIVGFNDLADETTVGLVNRMATLADAVSSTVNITTADLGAAPAAYSQAYAQANADLTNENKAAINQLATDLNAAITALNTLIANSKTAGQMTT